MRKRYEVLLVGLVEEPRPVLDRSTHVAGVDEVEGLPRGPVGFNIVHFEDHVGGHTVELRSVREEEGEAYRSG